MPRWQNHGQWSYVNIDCVRAPSLTLCPVLKLQELGKNATSFLLHQHDRYATHTSLLLTLQVIGEVEPTRSSLSAVPVTLLHP